MFEPEDRPLRVFLCHSSNDRLAVRELYQRLSIEGWIDAWLDTEKLYPGQDWNFEIEKAVEAADVIMVCLSNNSVTKEGYIQRELRIILDLADYKPEGTLFVIPVRLEECEPPRRLRTWQYADFFPKEDRDNAYARLLVSLRMRATRLGISTINPVEEKARSDAESLNVKPSEEMPKRNKEDLKLNEVDNRNLRKVEEEGGKDRQENKEKPAKKRTQNSREKKSQRDRIINDPAEPGIPHSPARARGNISKEVAHQASEKEAPFKAQEQQAKAQQTGRDIRNISFGVIILLMIIVVWSFFSKFQQQSPPNLNNGDPTACVSFADIPVAEQYDEPPTGIDQSKQYFATVKLAKGGEFKIQLFPDKAPRTVNSFVFLACKGYFNGVTFHRVLEGFMAQGGDPTGTGTGGPGYEFVNEDSDLTFDKPGVLAMANSGRDTNGSQFFITFAPAPHLNGGYTIFGQVVEGMDVVNAITRRDPQQNPDFEGDAMESVTITEQ